MTMNEDMASVEASKGEALAWRTNEVEGEMNT